jgi:hypothetical protein
VGKLPVRLVEREDGADDRGMTVTQSETVMPLVMLMLVVGQLLVGHDPKEVRSFG